MAAIISKKKYHALYKLYNSTFGIDLFNKNFYLSLSCDEKSYVFSPEYINTTHIVT